MWVFFSWCIFLIIASCGCGLSDLLRVGVVCGCLLQVLVYLSDYDVAYNASKTLQEQLEELTNGELFLLDLMLVRVKRFFVIFQMTTSFHPRFSPTTGLTVQWRCCATIRYRVDVPLATVVTLTPYPLSHTHTCTYSVLPPRLLISR